MRDVTDHPHDISRRSTVSAFRSPVSGLFSRFRSLLSLGSILLATLALATTLEAQPGGGGNPGVTLYSDANFRGVSQTFYYDTTSLQGGYLGPDRASSMRIDKGCEVTLFRDVDYRGSSATLHEDVADLGNTRVGNDSVSSLRIDCRRGGPGHGGGPGYGGGPGQGAGGVTLFTAPGFQGRNETFRANEGVLNNNSIGVGTRSIRVGPGCQVTVFEHSDYRGTPFTFDQDVQDLGSTRYGARQVGSIQVDCRQAAAPGYPGGGARGVSLYRDEDYRGRTQHFSDHHADLGGTQVGNDSTSSVRVSQGCRAVLYSDANYRGRSTVIEYDTPSMKGTAVGNDNVSSLTIECGGRY